MNDFKGFKKVSDSESHAVFRHENGSELKVAKAPLSHKMRKQLDGLPIYAADGVDTEPPQSLKADDDSQSQNQVQSGVPGVSININSQPNPQQQQSVPPPASNSGPQPTADDPTGAHARGDYSDITGSQPGWKADLQSLIQKYPVLAGRNGQGGLAQLAGSAPTDHPDIPSQPAGMVASNDSPLNAIAPPPGSPDPMPDQFSAPAQQTAPAPIKAAPIAAPIDAKQQIHQELSQEDQAWQHDLENGHIDPQTYQSLFAKKDTLGKIGTIFGLMLSGAGSGLSRQPNALMAMMNSQIQNDLEAQKSSKTNANNYLRTNQQNLVSRAEAKNLNAEAYIKAQTFANMQMNRVGLQSLVQQTQKLPMGSPQRQEAEQKLASMSAAVNNENYNLADVASSNLARMKMMMGDSGGGQNVAQQIRQKQIMGFITPEQSKEALKEIGQTQNHVQLNQNALDSFDKIARMTTLGGKLSSPVQYQKQIDAEWNPMMDKLTKDTEGRVTPITVDMMSALKPSLTDNAETGKIKREKLSSILNAGFATPTLDSLGVQMGKGEFVPHGTNQQASNPKEIRYDTQGNAYTRGPDGRPVRINQTAGR